MNEKMVVIPGNTYYRAWHEYDFNTKVWGLRIESVVVRAATDKRISVMERNQASHYLECFTPTKQFTSQFGATKKEACMKLYETIRTEEAELMIKVTELMGQQRNIQLMIMELDGTLPEVFAVDKYK